MFKRLCIPAAIAVLLLSSCGGGAPDDPTPAPGPDESTCVDFELEVVGTQYVLGDSFAEGPATITIDQFFTGGVAFDNFAEIQAAGLSGGSGNDLWINNVTVDFVVPNTSGWSVLFGEYGGEVNLGVDGNNIGVDTADFHDWDGAMIGGGTVSVSGGENSPDGELLIEGSGLTELSIGGQELAIDAICPLE